MTSYQITSTATGHVLGVYEGETADAALDAMARDAGYASYSAMCESTERDEDEARADLRVVEA